MNKPRYPKTCECGNEKAKTRDVSCAACAEIERQRKEVESTAHRLRAILRFNDWITTVELADAAGVDSMVASSQLYRMVRTGELERRGDRLAYYRLKRQRRAA